MQITQIMIFEFDEINFIIEKYSMNDQIKSTSVLI